MRKWMIGAVWIGLIGWTQAQVNEQAFHAKTVQLKQLIREQAEKEGVWTQPALQTKLKRWNRALAQDANQKSPFVRARYDFYQCALALGALAAKDPLYGPSVKEIEDRLERWETKASDLAGKLSNGIYRVTEMSGLWAAKVGADEAEVELVMERLKYENRNSPTVHRQMKNGLYRTLEMYLLIAKAREIPSDQIDPILLRLREKDAQAKTIFEQIENGLDRSIEMLVLVVKPVPVESKKKATP
jgi:hypothetical protein